MARKFKVDMTGVESYKRCPEGEHLARLKKIDMGTIQGSGDDCLKAVFEVIKGDGEGCQVFETFSLSEKALWKLKSFLEAIGMKANGKFQLDLDKLEGKICILDVIHDEYNGQKRAKIASYIEPSEDDEDDDDDEDEDEEEEKPVKKTTKKAPAKASSKSKKLSEEDEDEDDEDEDEDDDEPPVKKSKKSEPKSVKKTANKKSAKPKKDEDEDDDEDDDWEEDDD